MKVENRNPIDVELTNRCNALCSFCPRDVTPEQGFMTFETFKQVIARAKEIESIPRITMTGQGESTLHRNWSISSATPPARALRPT